jgi:hypothetical protein
MSEPTFGQVYHTKDGKTVYFDPKTHQVSVFEGILTVDKIVEPAVQANSGDFLGEQQMEDILKNILGPGMFSFDFVVSPAQYGLGPEPEEEQADILGPKDYYILIREDALPLSVSASMTPAWVSEFRNGHKPDYKGFRKHKILKEQWDWLNTHKACSVVAWYSQECPAFVTLACQDHAKIIKPVPHQEEVKDSSTPALSLESSSVHTSLESVLTEERDI